MCGFRKQIQISMPLESSQNMLLYTIQTHLNVTNYLGFRGNTI